MKLPLPHPVRASILAAGVLICAGAALPGATTAQAPRPQPAPYFPERFEWTRRPPAQAGMDGARLDTAIQFAIANENPATKDLAVDLATTFGREPFDTPIGPIAPRGALNGIIVRHGYVVAEWGETNRVDMTFSVTKSFLSTVVGLAWQKGLIRDVGDPVRDYVPGTDLFEGVHNSKITWDHLLRQTSDWQGTLWGKPDWADRPEGERPSDWPNRRLSEPGTRYKYNDVRVNLLALSALHVLRRPLPQVLREEIMEPIGASSGWRWHGYDNAWIELDGQRMQSMTGGGHWGGGMFISARDMARFGYLFLRNGTWKDRQIVSPAWIQMARTPGAANQTYGYMNWFLNTDRKPLPNAPATAVTFQGNGSNIIYIDWEHDLVVVVRWIQQRQLNEFLGLVLGAIAPQTPPGPGGADARDLPADDSVRPVKIVEVPGYSEGIVFDRRGTAYISDTRHGTVYAVTPDGKARVWATTGAPNGHKVLPDGTHLVCDGTERAVLHLDASGKILGKASSESGGTPLRAPNDLTLDPKGGFYFTDPGGSDEKNPIGTIHYVDPAGRTHLVAGALAFPNGIVLRPDGRTLLVGESGHNRILSFPVLAPGKVGERRVFATLPEKSGDQIANAPDGMALDEAGNLFVAHYGMHQVQVLAPDGGLLRRYPGGNLTTSNVAFGGPNRDRLYITGALGDEKTSRGALFRLDLPGVRGLPVVRSK